MGQVIAFPLPPIRCADLTADLNTPECSLLLAIRWWFEARHDGEDPIPRLLQALETAGAFYAAFAIDRLMTVVARSAARPIDIHWPLCPNLSLDEKRLLEAVGLAQNDAAPLAAKMLERTLLPAAGVEFAIGPLKDLGQLLAKAGLFLPRHRVPGWEQPRREPHQPSQPLG